MSYKNKLLGASLGCLTGIISAGLVGLTKIIPASHNRPDMSTGGQRTEYDTTEAVLIGSISGAIIGSVLGWLIGNNFIYYF